MFGSDDDHKELSKEDIRRRNQQSFANAMVGDDLNNIYMREDRSGGLKELNPNPMQQHNLPGRMTGQQEKMLRGDTKVSKGPTLSGSERGKGHGMLSRGKSVKSRRKKK